MTTKGRRVNNGREGEEEREEEDEDEVIPVREKGLPKPLFLLLFRERALWKKGPFFHFQDVGSRRKKM